jgi:hypothetical protein
MRLAEALRLVVLTAEEVKRILSLLSGTAEISPWHLFGPAPAKGEQPEDLRELVGKRLMASKLIARVVDSLGEDETFGASRVAAETNRRYHRTLKKPMDARTVSTVLRRRRDAGELHQVRPGSAAHEALYSKGGRG